jgi:hypothetical protein
MTMGKVMSWIRKSRPAAAYGVYFVVGLGVMLPLLIPGFILTLDMVFTPTMPMPQEVTSSYLFRAGLHYLNLFIPSDVLQKLMLLSILVLSGIGMHRLIRFLRPAIKGQEWGTYAAGIFFMINPFTYSRFMAGQYAVLLGYALLPWFVRLLMDFGRAPRLKTALKLGGLASLVGIVSIHTVGELALLAAVAAVVALWRYRQHLKVYLRYGLIAAAVFLVTSSYWLIPLALGKGSTAQTIGQFTSADTDAFDTVGSNPLVKMGNIARLQGFWAEERGLYLLPQDRVAPWGLMALVIIGLVIWGGFMLWRRRRALFALFAASGLVAMLLAAGAMEPLAQNIPLLAGYREPHKLVGLFVLAYSVLLAFGVKAALASAQRRSEMIYGITAGVLLILPFLFTRTMLWGFDGQLTPRQYPGDWFSINQQLKQDDDDFAVLFLPWHQYMSFQFAGRIIANPAPAFFSKPTFVSADPELDGATGGRITDRQKALHSIVTSSDKQHLAERLAGQNIKYIILAKELDYEQYDYLNDQAGLQRLHDYHTATVYENQAWRTRQ